MMFTSSAITGTDTLAIVAAAVATVTVMMITWIRYKKPDVSMSLNGSLAGLVAITAGCDTVSPTSAAIIGIAAGFIVVFGIEFIDKVLKVDDPVGAVGVHGLNGAFGPMALVQTGKVFLLAAVSTDLVYSLPECLSQLHGLQLQ